MSIRNLNNYRNNVVTFLNGLEAVLGETPTQQAAIASLTNSTGGTVDGTLDDTSTAVTGVDGTGLNAASKADVDLRLAAINNNIAELNTKVDAILTALRNHGLIAS